MEGAAIHNDFDAGKIDIRRIVRTKEDMSIKFKEILGKLKV